MNRIKTKVIIVLMITIPVLFFLAKDRGFLHFESFSQSRKCKTEEKVKNLLISGQILSIYRDGDNHNAKMVELQSGETILNTSFLILEVTGVFDQIRVGDFIVKENGSLKLEVKRNNSELDFILDYGCND